MKRNMARESWVAENNSYRGYAEIKAVSERQAAESLSEIADCQLSRRDQISVAALQGLIARSGHLSYASGGSGGAGSGGYGGTHESGTSADAIAEKAYQYADAMIKAANK